MPEEEGPEIELYLELPEGRLVTTLKGENLIAFTADEFAQLLKIYNSYIYLGDLIIYTSLMIDELSLQINEYKQQVLSYEIMNEVLKVQNAKYKAINTQLQLKVNRNQRKNFLRTLGVSALVGVGTGLIGVAVGKSI